MASRLLSRSKTLTLTLTRSLVHPSPIDPLSSSQSLRCLHSLTSVARSQPSGSRPSVSTFPAVASILPSPKNLLLEKILPRFLSLNAHGGLTSQLYHSAVKESNATPRSIEHEEIPNAKEVVCFSPLEAVVAKPRSSGLVNQSLKIKRMELSQKTTYALIPALILISKSSLTTSLLIFSVYWQIYGYLKEILLDYVHQDVTRTWVLVYLKVLLLILVKDTIVDFGLV